MQSTHHFDKTRFLKQCAEPHIRGSAVPMSELDAIMYNGMLEEIVEAGLVFVIDQAEFPDAPDGEGTVAAMIQMGTLCIENNLYAGMDGFLAYYGDSSDDGAAAMAFLFVMPPEEVLALPEGKNAKPVWTAIASDDNGLVIAAMGQFTEDGVYVSQIADNEHSEELSKFLCAGAYQSFTISMALRLTNAQHSEFDPASA